MLPYSREVYFSLFAELNLSALGPSIGAVMLAAVILYTLLVPSSGRSVPWLAPALLAILWAGNAWFWAGRVFADLNFLAPFYGGLAAAQALACAAMSFIAGPAPERPDFARRWGSLLLLSAAVLWPLADLTTGPGWPAVRLLGLHTVPLLLLTLAWLLRRPANLPTFALLLVPVLLAAVSGYEAYVLRLPADPLVPLAAGFTIVALMRARRLVD